MKSSIYRAETANAGMGLLWFWHHLVVLLLEETVLLYDQKSLQNAILTVVRYHYPNLTLHFAELRIYNGKIVIVKSWAAVRGKITTVPVLE